MVGELGVRLAGPVEDDEARERRLGRAEPAEPATAHDPRREEPVGDRRDVDVRDDGVGRDPRAARDDDPGRPTPGRLDPLDGRPGPNLDAEPLGERGERAGDRVHPAARVPDPLVQLDVRDHPEGGRGAIRVGADVGREPPEELAQLGRADMGRDRVVERPPGREGPAVPGRQLREGAERRRRPVDEEHPGDPVELADVLQEAPVAVGVARLDRADPLERRLEVLREVEARPGRPAIAGERLDRHELELIGEARAGGGVEVLEDVAHRHDRRAGVEAEAALPYLPHLSADLVALLEHGHPRAAPREPDGGRQPADPGADDGDLDGTGRAHDDLLVTLPRSSVLLIRGPRGPSSGARRSVARRRPAPRRRSSRAPRAASGAHRRPAAG